MSNKGLVILIPAYQPPASLPDLITNLATFDKFHFVIVDDGSHDNRNTIFSQLQERDDTDVLRHKKNRGKGQALKTGIKHILSKYPDSTGIVTVDADGQHLPSDVVNVANTLIKNPSSFCLGVRHFKGSIPLRSRVGNAVTRALFSFCSGKDLVDTQTGLRGIPMAFAKDILSIDADGYEFEFEALFKACRQNIPLIPVKIETIYEEGNPSSHFNPFVDSLKIYFVFIRFLSSSLMAALIDMLVFSIAFFATGNLLQSMISGRICSSLFQFYCSKHFVFNSKQAVIKEFSRFAALVIIIMSISYNAIDMIRGAGVNTYLAKVSVEVLLFFTSFAAQRLIVFKKGTSHHVGAPHN